MAHLRTQREDREITKREKKYIYIYICIYLFIQNAQHKGVPYFRMLFYESL